MNTILLSNLYLAPIDYYISLGQSENVLIEQHDHFEKQTYRNRCRILTSNGPMDLVVPIIRPKEKCPTKDILISYREKWQQTHWRAIESAYNSSPFFEYYKEDFEPFFTQKINYLIDLNNGLMDTVLQLIHLPVNYQLTDTYKKKEEVVSQGIEDLRKVFHPKQDNKTDIKPYYQVFDQKFGFQGGLSIIDLLFNLGPEALIYLKR